MSIEAGIRSGIRSGLYSGLNPSIGSIAGVTRDATSSKYAPADTDEWDALLAVAGIASGAPEHVWLMADAASPITDAIGADDLSETGGGALYQQSNTGWSRQGVTFTDGGGMTLLTAASYNASTLFLGYVRLTDTPAATRSAIYAQGEIGIETTRFLSGDTNIGTADVGTTLVRPYLIKVDRTNSVKKIYSDQETIAQTYASATNVVGFGSVVSSSAAMWVGYGALWTGAAAELSDAQIRTLLTTLGFTVAW